MKRRALYVIVAGLAAATYATAAPTARADETCLSPYTAALVKGQEAYVHVWTLGEPGLGDESDKLVTIDADPKSKSYGKVISSVSVGGRGEAHHMGFTGDRKYLWAGRLDDSKIFIFDVGTNPSKPKLVNTITGVAMRRSCRNKGPSSFPP
jgi:methanethiol oxidase